MLTKKSNCLFNFFAIALGIMSPVTIKTMDFYTAKLLEELSLASSNPLPAKISAGINGLDVLLQACLEETMVESPVEMEVDLLSIKQSSDSHHSDVEMTDDSDSDWMQESSSGFSPKSREATEESDSDFDVKLSRGERTKIGPSRAKQGNFPCNECGKVFVTFDKMTNHALLHLDGRFITCPSCTLIFSNPHLRNIHHRVVHHLSITQQPNYLELRLKERELIFDLLGLAPADNISIASWLCHGKRVSEIYVCTLHPTICQKRFRDFHKLEDHLMRHLKTGSFICPLCKSTYNSPHDRNRHLRTEHNKTIARFPKTKIQDKKAIGKAIKHSMYKVQKVF